MNSNLNLLVKIKMALIILNGIIVMCYASLIFSSCQHEQNHVTATTNNENTLKSGIVADAYILYWGHEKFISTTWKPIVVKKKIGSADLARFKSNFALHIQNGDGKKDLVSSAIIKIDGKQIFGPSDFRRKTIALTKEIKGLTVNSELKVELFDKPGSYIDVWIEGTLKPISNCGIVTDIEGNVYNTVTIGTQCWLTENLRTTKFNDGTDIPLITDDNLWVNLSTPGYCWYKNDSTSFKYNDGALYNWYTVNTGKLCPTGWHVPSDAEWKILEISLGMTKEGADSLNWRGTDIATQLRSVTGWSACLGTNKSGFNALGSGYRYGSISSIGTFENIGQAEDWWCSDKDNYLNDTNYAMRREIESYVGEPTCSKIYRNLSSRKNGVSVRCIKD